MRTALVTGANRGMGLAVTQSLAAAGLRVILGCGSVVPPARSSIAEVDDATFDRLPGEFIVSEGVR
jgi:NAD(P)-dependent dehydrogenase (short-subunit alcohol dehydrogenase family)